MRDPRNLQTAAHWCVKVCVRFAQVWLGQFGEAVDRLVPRSDFDAALISTSRQTLKEAAAAAEHHTREASSALRAAARTEMTALRAEIEQRVEGVGVRVGRTEEALAALRSSVGAVTASVGNKAEVAAVEARFKRFDSEIARRVGRPELEAELAKKLDVRVFLANSSSAAAAAVMASGGNGVSSGRLLGWASPRKADSPQKLAASGESMMAGTAQPQLNRLVGAERYMEQSEQLEDEEEASFSASMAAAARLAERVRARKGEAPSIQQNVS